MQVNTLHLKKNEDRRLRAGHLWIYSNEIDTHKSPLKNYNPGEEVIVKSADNTPLGVAYINPHSLITARLFSHNVTERLDITFFTQKIQSALALRMRLYNQPYYRLVFGESDYVPGLIIDRFNDILAVQLNTAGIDAKKELILSALQSILPTTQTILLRNDSPVRSHEGLEAYTALGWGQTCNQIQLEENHSLFHAPVLTGQKTGWFYDHRANRARLAHYVKDSRVLDVFSYLGGWGIQAARAGAKEVLCIDSSPLAIEWLANNAALNQVDRQVKTLCADAFDTLKDLHHAQEKFNLIVLDPPAFAKKQKDKKEGLLAYQRINELALKLLQPDGILISCSCSMHIDYQELINVIRRAALSHRCDLQILEQGHQAPDHPVHIAIPETNYLKMVIVRKIKTGRMA